MISIKQLLNLFYILELHKKEIPTWEHIPKLHNCENINNPELFGKRATWENLEIY